MALVAAWRCGAPPAGVGWGAPAPPPSPATWNVAMRPQGPRLQRAGQAMGRTMNRTCIRSPAARAHRRRDHLRLAVALNPWRSKNAIARRFSNSVPRWQPGEPTSARRAIQADIRALPAPAPRPAGARLMCRCDGQRGSSTASARRRAVADGVRDAAPEESAPCRVAARTRSAAPRAPAPRRRRRGAGVDAAGEIADHLVAAHGDEDRSPARGRCSSRSRCRRSSRRAASTSRRARP